ncbi:hypothetical protein [Isoptericola sp. NPDC057653]|uniref:hypothetical protein n=1 Tax=Isoptericola sp. NPDC057653 TaxID=3346195 RepID=UPI0036BDA23A
MTKKPLVLTSVALAGALALAGCDGGPSTDAPTAGTVTGSGQPEEAAEESAPAQDVPPYSEIADEVKANVAALTSLTLTGTFVDDGETMTIEGSGAVTGEGDFTLTMSGTVDGKPADATILRVDGATYLKASPQFFAANFGDSDGAISEALGDKYLQLPKEAGADDLSLESFVDEFAADLPSAADVPDDTPGELVDFHGQQVYEYAADDGTSMQVTADGSDQLVGVSSPGDGEMVLSDLNEAPDVQAPAADDVMDLSGMTGN